MQMRQICGLPWKNPTITKDGVVTVCCADCNLRLAVGDIRERTFKQIWEGPEITQLRLAHLMGDFSLNPKCRCCRGANYSYMTQEEMALYLKIIGRQDILPSLQGRIPSLEEPQHILLQIETNDTCNLVCDFCDFHNKNPVNDILAARKKVVKDFSMGRMDIGVYKRIVDEVAGYIESCPFFSNSSKKLNMMWVWGGEPFLHPDFVSMLDYAMEKPIYHGGEIDTNAVLLGKNVVDRLMELNLNSFTITFSIDAASKQTYEKVRKGGKYDQMVQNIIYFLKRADEKNFLGFRTMLQFIITPLNHHEVKDFIAFWDKYAREGRDYLFLRILHNGDCEPENKLYLDTLEKHEIRQLKNPKIRLMEPNLFRQNAT